MSPLTRISCDPFSRAPFPLGLSDFETVLAEPRHLELREFLADGKAALNGPTGVAVDECVAEICEPGCPSGAEWDVASDVAEFLKSYSTTLKRSNAIRRISRRGWISCSESDDSETSESREEDSTPKTASSSIYSDSDVSNLNLDDRLNMAATDVAADTDSVKSSGIPDSNVVGILDVSTVVPATPETKTIDNESSDHTMKDIASPKRQTPSSWLGSGIADFLALEQSASSDFLSSRCLEVPVANAASSVYDSASPPSKNMSVPKRESSYSHGAKSLWRDVVERRNAGEWERKIMRRGARASSKKEEKKTPVSQVAAQSPVGSNEIEEPELVTIRGRKSRTHQADHLSRRQSSLEDQSKTGRRSSSSRFVEGFENEGKMDKKSIMNLLGNAKEEEKKRGVVRNMRVRMSRMKLHVWKALKSTREKV
jgi:hypothetical protein